MDIVRQMAPIGTSISMRILIGFKNTSAPATPFLGHMAIIMEAIMDVIMKAIMDIITEARAVMQAIMGINNGGNGGYNNAGAGISSQSSNGWANYDYTKWALPKPGCCWYWTLAAGTRWAFF